MKNTCKFVSFLLLTLALPVLVSGQDSLKVVADTGCVQQDLPDVIRDLRHKPPKDKSDSEGSLLLVPVIGSNPATGLIFGVSGQYAVKMPGSTLYSMIIATAQIT